MTNSGPPLRLPDGVRDAVFLDADPVERWAAIRAQEQAEPVAFVPELREPWRSQPGPAAEAIEMLVGLTPDLARCHGCAAGVGFVVTGDDEAEPVRWATLWIIVEAKFVVRMLCEDCGNREMGV